MSGKFKILPVLLFFSNIIFGQDTIPPPDVCPGEKGLRYWADGNPASRFFWKIEGGKEVPDDEPLDNNITIDWFESSDITKYSLSVVELSEAGCYGDTVKVDINFKEYSKVILAGGAPLVRICEDSILTLDAGDGFVEYEWNDGESRAREFLVTGSGQYWVHATSVENCQSTDTVIVNVIPLPKIDIGDLVQICNEEIEFDPGNYAQYNWSTGSIEQSITVGQLEQDSLFWVEVTDFYGCKGVDSLLVQRCIDAVKVPTAFTPNGDGTNEVWEIEGIDRFPNAEVRVFNRRKILVFESTGIYQPWDGKSANGRLLPVYSYHYIIDLKEEGYPIKQGFVTIIY